jgi:hypothetical protein
VLIYIPLPPPHSPNPHAYLKRSAAVW